jgi:HK97 family phage portal protein
VKIFGLEIRRSQKNLLNTPGDRGRWWHTVFESYPGAWQQNVEVKLDQVLAYSAVYSCVTLISNDIAKLRLKLVQRNGEVWQETENSAYTPVLRRPNPYQNRIQFFQHWVASKLAHGNVYVLKEKDNRGVVTALHVLDPHRVRTLVSDQGEVFYELKQDNLTGLEEATVMAPATEIIHDKMNAIYHPLVGVSPIFACGLAATQGLRIQNNSAVFFGNGARPGGVLTAPGEIKQETAQRIKDYWDTNFSGANSGKIAVLGDGLKYEQMMMSAADAQLIEQLKWSAETVAAAFHVPFHMIGGPPPAYNNIEALNAQYYSQCLQVLIESIETCLDEGLRLPSSLGTEFDLDDLLRMDTATKVRAVAEAIGAGFMSPNEARRKFDLPPVEGGASPYLQQQNYSLAALAQRDAMNPLATPGPNPIDAAPALPPPNTEAEERAWTAEALLALQKGLAA